MIIKKFELYKIKYRNKLNILSQKKKHVIHEVLQFLFTNEETKGKKIIVRDKIETNEC